MKIIRNLQNMACGKIQINFELDKWQHSGH